MRIDPIFSFKEHLPDVSNLHQADMTLDCGLGGRGQNVAVTIDIPETGQEIVLDSAVPGSDRADLDAMPGALIVEQLREGRVVESNVARIANMLAEHNGIVCACTSANGERRGDL